MAGKKRKGELREGVRTLNIGAKVKVVDRKLVGDEVEFKKKKKGIVTNLAVGRVVLGEGEMDKESDINSEGVGEMEIVEERNSERGKEMAGDESMNDQVKIAGKITGTGATDMRNLADVRNIGRKEDFESIGDKIQGSMEIH